MSPELIQAVIEYSALSAARSWRYVQTVLDSCLRDGITTAEKFLEHCRYRAEEKTPRQTTKTKAVCSGSSLDFPAVSTHANPLHFVYLSLLTTDGTATMRYAGIDISLEVLAQLK